ncbi:tRNA (N6-isopentenyl adenosine(37)-C2)-methylthiotransferase MiaB [Patescibacteria group bacterium]|nr:tRNA (N6-isopentenyl adenosine(37)-C2)-methylthiotransferase MiaB [Patescibacteria group bacterium]
MQTYHIITFGCQMNRSDSERAAAVFERLGYRLADSAERADIVAVNACSVRQTAINRIWGFLKKFENERNEKKMTTILTGCVLPEDRKRLSKNFDFVFNIKNLNELEMFLSGRNLYISKNYFDILPKYDNYFQSNVPIMSGCDNYCSYCAVPYVRGGESSRKIKEILAEINESAKNGCKEITLLGQNVNSFSPEDAESFSEQNPFNHAFAKLLWEVNQTVGIERILFVAAHPKDMNDEVIAAMALPKMANYLHLALQSGDNEILNAMNRKYTVEDYENIILKLGKIKPNIAIGTDIIVGFPGETREQFENTLKFYEKIKFDIAFLAMYSPRRGTVAAKLKDDVSRDEKKRRWHELQDLMEKITLKKNQKYLGTEVSVLIDKAEKDFAEGNSREMKRVRIYNSNCKKGDIVNVKIKEALTWILIV